VAPMTGKIIKIVHGEGSVVKKGGVVAIMEAMKMEHSLVAAVDGVVASVGGREGEIVEDGKVIAVITCALGGGGADAAGPSEG
jgi:biotin carboxyl carrier protein